MDTTNSVLLLLLALALVFYASRTPRRGGRSRTVREAFFDSENMPSELAQAQLLMSEVDLVCQRPVELYGRPDQVYLLANGRDIVVVDSKRRQRPVVYDKDRMQLGAYRVLLENSGRSEISGRRVMPYGYVRLVSRGRIRYIKVKLAPERAVLKLYQRYLQVSEGPALARGHRRGSGVCRRCDYRSVC